MKTPLRLLPSGVLVATFALASPPAWSDEPLGGDISGFNAPKTSAQADGESVVVRGLDSRGEGSGSSDSSGGSLEIEIAEGAVASAESSGGGEPLSLLHYEASLVQYAVTVIDEEQEDAGIRGGLPDAGSGLYSVVDTCADATDQEACQEQESCAMADGGTGQNYYVEFAEGPTSSNTQRVSRPLCLPAGEVPESGSMPIPVFAVEDLQRLDIAAAVSVVEPAPHTLINYNTNVYAEATAQEFTTTLAGYPVTVRVYPIEYTWDYGDGATLGPTQLTGYPLDEDQWDIPTDTSHRYTETGDVQVTLSTTFEGEYSVAGGPWLTVDGTSTVASAPVELSVWRAKVRNYADDCIENPYGTGC